MLNLCLPGWRAARWLLLLSLCTGSMGVKAQDSTPAPPTASKNGGSGTPQEAAEEPGEELPYGELAPAALQLDESKASPLIQELYAATRETKIPAIVDHLTKAKSLIDSGADVKATDSLGRTALHWVIFGSSY